MANFEEIRTSEYLEDIRTFASTEIADIEDAWEWRYHLLQDACRDNNIRMAIILFITFRYSPDEECMENIRDVAVRLGHDEIADVINLNVFQTFDEFDDEFDDDDDDEFQDDPEIQAFIHCG